MTHRWLLCLCMLAATMSAAAAQVDLVWINASTSVPAAYHDAIVLMDGVTGQQRPLAQSPWDSDTGSIISRPWHQNIGGTNYLYWFDNWNDNLWRGWDQNGNGVIDPIEYELLWNNGSISPDSIMEHNGEIVLSVDFAADGVSYGLWVLQDLNADGDYFDAGESTQVLMASSGSTMTVAGTAGPVAISSDDIEGAHFLANGDVIFYEDDNPGIYKLDRTTGTITSWMNYSGNPAFDINPDWGTAALPVPASDMDRITVDYSTIPATVYIAPDFNATQPWIYRAQDTNLDGDVNDTGEVVIFHNGSVSPTATEATDDIYWFQGSLYMSHERFTVPGGDFIRLTDLNMDGDALDAGEQTILGSLAGNDDPTMYAFMVVPSGTFGASTCVNFLCENDGLSASGSTITFTLRDIPAANQAGTDIALVAVSATPGGATPLGPGCVAGLTIDPLTQFFFNNPVLLAAFITPPLSAATAATPGLAVPAGLPVGTQIYYVGVILGPGGLGVSQSSVITVGP